mgnify:FL=1
MRTAMTSGQKELLAAIRAAAVEAKAADYNGTIESVNWDVRTSREVAEAAGCFYAPAVVVRGLHSRGVLEIVDFDYSNAPAWIAFGVRLVK